MTTVKVRFAALHCASLEMRQAGKWQAFKGESGDAASLD
jgi:hypothetical protein